MHSIHTADRETVDLFKSTFPEYKGRNVEIIAFSGPKSLHSYWSGGYRDYWAIVELSTGCKVDLSEMVWAPFVRMDREYVLSGLVPGYALFQHSYSGTKQYAKVHVLPDNLCKYLPSSQSLSWEERVVLAASRSLKSSYAGIKEYRKHEAGAKTGILPAEYDNAKLSLIEKGMLNKAGAITNEGRNTIQWTELYALAQERKQSVN